MKRKTYGREGGPSLVATATQHGAQRDWNCALQRSLVGRRVRHANVLPSASCPGGHPKIEIDKEIRYFQLENKEHLENMFFSKRSVLDVIIEYYQQNNRILRHFLRVHSNSEFYRSARRFIRSKTNTR